MTRNPKHRSIAARLEDLRDRRGVVVVETEAWPNSEWVVRVRRSSHPNVVVSRRATLAAALAEVERLMP